MFHRAKKIPVTQKDKDEKIPLYKLERVRRMRRTEEEKAEKESEKESEKDSERESEKESERSERSEEEKNDEEKEEGKKDKGEKKKRKIRLDMHLEQVKICPVIQSVIHFLQIFVDSSDAYVWLYDPIPWYKSQILFNPPANQSLPPGTTGSLEVESA